MTKKKKNVINNKGGRPKKPAHEKLSVHLCLRISPQLDALIDIKVAESKGRLRDRNAYIREALEKSTVKQIATPEFIKLLHDLSNLGNNVKDIRDSIRRYGYTQQAEKCDFILDELSKVLATGRHLRDMADYETESTNQEIVKICMER